MFTDMYVILSKVCVCVCVCVCLLYLAVCTNVEWSHSDPVKREVNEFLLETDSYQICHDPKRLTIMYEKKSLKMTAYTRWMTKRESKQFKMKITQPKHSICTCI